MRLISKRRLREFWKLHSSSREVLEEWYRIVNNKGLAWEDFHDLQATFASASHVGKCVVFNIGGNNYRLITQINYPTYNVFVKAVLTHSEYSRGKWQKKCGCI